MVTHFRTFKSGSQRPFPETPTKINIQSTILLKIPRQQKVIVTALKIKNREQQFCSQFQSCGSLRRQIFEN